MAELTVHIRYLSSSEHSKAFHKLKSFLFNTFVILTMTLAMVRVVSEETGVKIIPTHHPQIAREKPKGPVSQKPHNTKKFRKRIPKAKKGPPHLNGPHATRQSPSPRNYERVLFEVPV